MVNLFLFIVAFFTLLFLSRQLTNSLSRLFLRLTRSTKATIYLLQIIFFPGIIIHELAHLLTAGLLFVRTGDVEFSPEIKENGEVKMASVAIEKTDPIRRAIIGVAPVLLGLLLIFTTFAFFLSDTPLNPVEWNYIIAFVIVFEIGNTMFSSKKDLEGTLALSIVLVSMAVIFYFVNIRLPFSFIDLVNSSPMQDFLRRGALVLLAPIGVDLAIYLASQAIVKRY